MSRGTDSASVEQPPLSEVAIPTDIHRPSHDDLDREQLEQLHNATLKAAESCFEFKKLCATVLVPLAALLSIFTDKQLDSAVFLAPIVVVIAFWLADAVSYFYQRKLRSRMSAIWERRARRCDKPYTYIPVDKAVTPLRAAFNVSMLYYLALVVLVSAAYVLFRTGLIR